MSSMRRQRGVTLMELMVVMVIVGILSAIAYPAYRKTVMRTNRTNAKTALTQTAQTLRALLYADQHICGLRGTALRNARGQLPDQRTRSCYGSRPSACKRCRRAPRRKTYGAPRSPSTRSMHAR